MRNIIVILVAVAVLLVMGLKAPGRGNDAPVVAGEEIGLEIQLDLDEDIGLLIIDYDLGGNKGCGGMSNADRSMLKRDEKLNWSFDRQLYDISEDTVDLTVRFTLVTGYYEPNYDNIYPEEDMIPMEAVSFRAKPGDSCHIRITGNKAEGYKAIMEE